MLKLGELGKKHFPELITKPEYQAIRPVHFSEGTSMNKEAFKAFEDRLFERTDRAVSAYLNSRAATDYASANDLILRAMVKVSDASVRRALFGKMKKSVQSSMAKKTYS